MSIYDFKVLDMNGQERSLSEYREKVLLIVNTATECGFTPQYENLQNLYSKYKDRGFEILDFPCDQFGHQAPGSNDEIATFCSARFGVTFPQFSKIDVNGENQSLLFEYLKSEQGFKGFDLSNKMGKLLDDMLLKVDPDYAKKSDIKWNFTKFLVDKNGQVVARFEPIDDILEVEKSIVDCL